ncbi:MAG TPA: MmgE/PrpD family protein [Acidimicrobiales bacterium]|nr:MmgE/PrpD family protein [Acidimicrobiales bacterium]
MDALVRRLVELTSSFSLAEVPDRARRAAVRHIVDSVACAIAGYGTEPGRRARRFAGALRHEPGATVIGAGTKSAPAYAAFANTVMVRALDWNDGMLARGGGHPSDMLGALFATGEVAGSSGAQVLEATVLAYELLGALGRVAPLTERGWDQGLFVGAAAALAMGKLLGLRERELANALSLSLVPAVPLLVTRRGEISMWKNAATAWALLNATNAVAFAEAGMTGPSHPFEGPCGVFDQVTGRIEPQLPADPEGALVIELSHQKLFPAESHAQALLGLLPRLRAFTSVEEIEAIEIEAYAVLRNAIGSHPSVYDPKTPETADHSLPYLLAVGLVDGAVTPASFTPERLADPALRPLMARISIREDPDLTAGYRPARSEISGAPRARITVRKRSGEVLEAEASFPKGHARNPFDDDDVNAKLDVACAGRLTESQRETVRGAWWRIEEAPTLAPLMATIADLGASEEPGARGRATSRAARPASPSTS